MWEWFKKLIRPIDRTPKGVYSKGQPVDLKRVPAEHAQMLTAMLVFQTGKTHIANMNPDGETFTIECIGD